MGLFEIAFLIAVIIVPVGIALFFLNRWAGRKMAEQQSMIAQHKTTVSIYVIDKKKEKAQNANFPKAVLDQMPRWNRFMKMPLIKAKIGPQIMTLMCDKAVFNALPVKKTVKVDLAGMYIVHMKGMKTKKELADFRRSRKGEAGESAPSPWYKRVLGRG